MNDYFSYYGYKKAIDRIAYAWFYRLIALYFMKINEYLPENIQLDLKDAFCMLHRLMPNAFYQAHTEAILLETAVSDKFFLQLKTNIPLSDWLENPEILGWLYQFYRSEEKSAAFSHLKNSGKISMKQLPAATQLFTPDWIVKYMTENSLGRLLNEHFPKKTDNGKWNYYIEEANQSTETKKILDLAVKNTPISLCEIKIIDPCMGSGHTLIYVFDLLMQIYRQQGIATEKAVRHILEDNLYGLDIDETVTALANFQVLMKASAYDKTVCCKGYHTNLYAVTKPICPSVQEKDPSMKELYRLLTAFKDADEVGSLLRLPELDFEKMQKQAESLGIDKAQSEKIDRMINIAEVLSQKYDVVITNPPYMGKKNLDRKLAEYLAQHYPEGKSELYAAFMLRCLEMTKPYGYTSMITVHTWMFIRSFAALRQKLLRTSVVSTMLHTGAATFDELNAFNVLASAFCLRKVWITEFKSKFIYLGEYGTGAEKQRHMHDEMNTYTVDQTRFDLIPEAPFVYRISDTAMQNFKRSLPLETYAKPKQGMATSDNRRFVRYWFEVDKNDICFHAVSSEEAAKSGCRWFPYNKGGFFRKWYGMNEYVVDWENGGEALKKFDRAVLRNQQDYFKSGITWSLFGFENFGVRYKDNGFLFDVSGSSMFPPEELTLYILAFLASKVAFLYLSILAPTVNFQVGNISDLPLLIDRDIKPEIDALAAECIELAKSDWDDYEQSWDFKFHPLLRFNCGGKLADSFLQWEQYTHHRFQRLKQNEERINELFISLYRLEEELTPEVVMRDISVRQAEKGRDIRSFLSFAVGCMFGRFNDIGLSVPTANENLLILNDDSPNGILPNFESWLCSVFETQHLEENLSFIASALGGKGTPREVISRYFRHDFYTDHLSLYQKHPIYWMLDSGETHAFRALFYIHRYDSSLLETVQQYLCSNLKPVTPTAKAEITEYSEKLKDMIQAKFTPDLNDGILHNYSVLQDILEPIDKKRKY